MSNRYNLRKRHPSIAIESYESRKIKRRRLGEIIPPSSDDDDSDKDFCPEKSKISSLSPLRNRLKCIRNMAETKKSDDDDEFEVEIDDKESGESEYESPISISEEGESDDNSDSDNEGDIIGDSEEEYFTLDKSPLVGVITRYIRKTYPDLPENELKNAIKRAMRKVKDDLVDEYCGCEPKDESWKIELKDEVIKTLEPRLKAIRLEMKDEQPTLEKILKARIPSADQKKAIQLFDVLKNLEPYTMEYYSIADDIRRIIAVENEISPDDIPRIEAEEKRLRGLIGNHDQALKMRILQLNATDMVKIRIYEMYTHLMSLNSDSSEYNSLKQKIVWAVNLPHLTMKLPEIAMKDKSPYEVAKYCSEIYKGLDEKLYGMRKVKERLIQIVNNRIYNPRTKAMVALKGNPGVGKTAVAKALAETLGLPFERVSLGGMEDPSLFKGTDNSWVGATPSILLQILRRMKVANGIVLFDEIDKLGANDKSDTNSRGKIVQYALLHITDYIQNSEFQDVFLNEFPHDLSNIWFMFAMNDDKWIDSALRDRLDVVSVDKYTNTEILRIIQLHILPRTLEDVGLQKTDCTITEQACGQLISLLGHLIKDNGLRPVEKELHQLVSRINMLRTQLYTRQDEKRFEDLLIRAEKAELIEKEQIFVEMDDIRRRNIGTVKLSYNLPDFNGFPYQITTTTIQKLWSNPRIDTSYLSMYI